MSQKQLLCDFRAKIEFLALIYCVGVKLLVNTGFQFFERLTPFWGLFIKTTPFLCLFFTVNINKVILPNKSVILHCILQLRSRLKVL